MTPSRPLSLSFVLSLTACGVGAPGVGGSGFCDSTTCTQGSGGATTTTASTSGACTTTTLSTTTAAPGLIDQACYHPAAFQCTGTKVLAGEIPLLQMACTNS